MAKSNTTKSKVRRTPASPNPDNKRTCTHLLNERERRIIEKAYKVLEKSAVYRTEALLTPGAVREYLQLRMGHLEHEQFHVIWLDSQNRVISFDAMFSGTINQTSVFPREIVKTGLANNAAGVIFAHNHPSGTTDPSTADQLLTRELKTALAMVDISVKDHFIIAGGGRALSFMESGLL